MYLLDASNLDLFVSLHSSHWYVNKMFQVFKTQNFKVFKTRKIEEMFRLVHFIYQNGRSFFIRILIIVEDL